VLLLVLLILAVVGAPLIRWQYTESAKTACLSNERRLATALLLYQQDHDGRLPPPDYALPDGEWRHWVGILQPYITHEEITVCPVNGARGAREPRHGYLFPYSYALNERFFGVFGPGPFPLENLEIPAQTALLVESGGWRGRAPGGQTGLWSASVYTDTARWPAAYPSPHDERMNVAAADGHVVTVKVAHYQPGGHDPLYGRLGGTIYNWNGGHPNGDLGGPPIE